MINLDDTGGCPTGFRCESCGDTGEITVQTATTVVGTLCLSLCPRCATSTVAPPVAISTAVRLVLQHCQHLGIDADQMAAEMDKHEGDQ